MSDTCTRCGLTYDDFRTGYTFASIRDEMFIGSEDSAKWKNKRRNGVLGYWHETKLKMWDDHLHLCEVNSK